MKINNFITCIILSAISTINVCAQYYDYDKFIHEVAKSNTAYLAEQYNIDIAIAEEQAAKVFNDPEISFTYGNNQDWDLQMGQSYETGLAYSIPLGPVRSSRIRVASCNRQLEDAAVADYWCSLKQQSAQAYATAWLAKQKVLLFQDFYEMMQQIARGDSIRLEIGDLNFTDATQSFLETRAARGEWLNAITDYQNALIVLSSFIGGQKMDSIGDLPLQTDIFPYLEVLLQQAQENRCDLRYAYLNQELSIQCLRLIRAEQAPEISLNAGYIHSTEVKNYIAPAPQYNGFSVGISLPLTFSAINRGARTAAEHRIRQSELNYQTIRQQVDAEVQQAFHSYQMAEEIRQNYNSSILTDAERILQNRRMAYTQGEVGLLSLLDAKRTYQNILSNYFEAIANSFIASANLARTIGK